MGIIRKYPNMKKSELINKISETIKKISDTPKKYPNPKLKLPDIGLCAARHLVNHGYNTSICRSRAYHLTDAHNYHRVIYQLSGGKEAQIGRLPVEPVDLIVDALIGCGLQGTPRGPTVTLIDWANDNGAPVLALDVPTGVDPTTGKSEGKFIRPDVTLTLGLPKTGRFALLIIVCKKEFFD